jgi:hypothetical protein
MELPVYSFHHCIIPTHCDTTSSITQHQHCGNAGVRQSSNQEFSRQTRKRGHDGPGFSVGPTSARTSSTCLKIKAEQQLAKNTTSPSRGKEREQAAAIANESCQRIPPLRLCRRLHPNEGLEISAFATLANPLPPRRFAGGIGGGSCGGSGDAEDEYTDMKTRTTMKGRISVTGAR